MKWVLPVLGLSLLCCRSNPAQEKTAPAAKPRTGAAASEARESANPSAANCRYDGSCFTKRGGISNTWDTLRGSQDVHVDFTSAQLNDVLKSLTVLDLSGRKNHGRGLQLRSTASSEIATLRWRLGENQRWRIFLALCAGQSWKCETAAGRRLPEAAERRAEIASEGQWNDRVD